jgi:mRNA-degrading endonuclease YafQ of YafQ-DinJ toxin-antitoxin module
MRTASSSGQFQRDVKRLQKRGKDMGKLKKLVEMLLAGETLPAKFKDIRSAQLCGLSRRACGAGLGADLLHDGRECAF